MKSKLIVASSLAVAVVRVAQPFRAASAARAQAPRGAVSPLPSFAEPGISPDGATIAFVSGGDIWEVPARGGDARLLVSHPATESRPLFSPDGKRLAFTSTRTGAGDIYVLTIATGDLARLTFDDAAELVTGGRPTASGSISRRAATRSSGMHDVYPRRGRRRHADAGRGRSLHHRVLRGAVARRATSSRSPRAPTPARSGGAKATVISTRARSGSSGRAAPGAGATRPVTERRREGRVADVERRRQVAVLHVRPQRRAEYLDTAVRCQVRRRRAPQSKSRPSKTGACSGRRSRRTARRSPSSAISGSGRWIPSTGQAHEVSIALRGAPAAAAIEHRTFSDQIQELALSPDGKKTAFTVARRDLLGVGEGWRRRDAGHDDAPSEEAELAWAPDSRRLVYVSDRDGTQSSVHLRFRRRARVAADVWTWPRRCAAVFA